MHREGGKLSGFLFVLMVVKCVCSGDVIADGIPVGASIINALKERCDVFESV